MPEGLIEEVNWRREDIRTVAERLTNIYRHSLPVIALERWMRFGNDVVSSILGGNSEIREVELRGPNFILAFRGPRNALIPIITEGRVEWRQREPRFVCYGNDEEISEVNRWILGEAKDRFDLLVLTDPLRLIFPKGRFAQSRIIRGRVELPL